jgi:hypothetical protein
MTITDTDSQVANEKPEPPDPYRSVLTMFKSPGVISFEAINGDKGKYLNPRQVFLFFWVAFFLLAPGSTVTPDLYGQLNNMPYSFVAKQMVEKKIKEKKTNPKAFEQAYADSARMVTCSGIALLVLLFAIPMRVLNRSKKLSFDDHVSISCEFITTVIICWLVVLSWLPASVAMYLLIVLLAILLYAFQRNAYKQTVARSIGRAALLVVSFFAVVMIYRTLVFFFTVWKS